MDVAAPARIPTRWAATATAAVLVLGLLPGVAVADHNPNHGDPCRGAVPATIFADYRRARQVHRAGIDCAFYRAITAGAGSNAQGQPVYRPRANVTRAQMAQFIVNTLISAGHDDRLPAGGQNQFDDIDGSFARVAINRLARARIVSGTGDDAYSPGADISRQQMASFIVQAANWAANPDVASDGRSRFTDVARGNVHKDNIEGGADAGLFQGTGVTTFAPGRLVVRDQMATFLVSLLRHAFDPDRAPTPYSVTAGVDDTNVDAGDDITGEVTGSNIRHVTVSGCGIAAQQLIDRNEVATGIQYRVQVPAEQPQGDCTLRFTVTFTNTSQRSSTIGMTVRRAANQAAVSLDQSAVPPGGQVTGQITGRNLASARVTGCGLSDEPAQDRDAGQAGIQFEETIPSDQPAGGCTLAFTVTYVDNRTETLSAELTVGTSSATTRPELLSATIVSTTTAAQSSSANPAGTVIRYVFDESVSAPDGARFFAYRANATRVAAAASAPQVEAGGTALLVRFPSIDTQALAAELTVATVDDAAVTDGQGQVNPEGAAALVAASHQAGITAAPDLDDVGPVRAGAQVGTTAVDFHFDEAAYTVAPGGFHLVLTDNRVVDCTGPARTATGAGGGQSAGGNGSLRITAVCTNPSGAQLSTSTIARGYLDPGTVSDVQPPPSGAAGGTTNPLQSVAVASGGLTTGPDLQSLLTAPGTGAGDADIVIFTFDTAVDAAVTANRFAVYDIGGREYLGITAQRQSGGGQNQQRVVVTFAADALDAAAGVSVRTNAVSDGTAPNRPAEIGIAGPPPAGTPGATDAPDLLTVNLSTTGSGGGQMPTATYTFDEDLDGSSGASQPSRFRLYLADGTALTCSGVAGPTFTIGTSGSARRQASCSSFQIAGASATAAQVAAAVLGTVDHGAVDDAGAGTSRNPEGAVRTTGGTGTPAQ